jgi:hypothetical protein
VIANEGKEITMAVQYRPTIPADLQIAQFGPSDVTENTCTVTKQNATISVKQPNDVAQTIKPLGMALLQVARENQRPHK